jgi:carboxypeptidase D
MLLKSVLTSALLALSLGSDIATASKHGRFAEIARAPQEKAKRAVEARNQKHVNPDKDYRFLNKNTKRECGAILLSATIILIDL